MRTQAGTVGVELGQHKNKSADAITAQRARPDLGKAKGYATKCLGVEFRDGNVGRFSSDEAPSAAK